MPITFVAEVSSNHHRDLNRCLAFIDAAARIGCQAVKFQLFKVRELFAPEILERNEKLRSREAWELPVEFLPALANRCRDRSIQFCCTPFYLNAVSELEPYVNFYKVASYELLWDELLEACAHTGKPVVLSTGMATLQEVERAVTVLRKAGCGNPTLLHCISGYPVPPQECNLAAIHTLRLACQCEVGWSDHSRSPAVLSRAVHHWGATMVEFHLDLDQEGEEYSTGHCWLPGQIEPVISAIQTGFCTDGTGVKEPGPSEAQDRDWRADPADGFRPLRKVREQWPIEVGVQ